ncbi:CRISPR-associated helicase Cas3' [Phytoactinopolyspora limicola]|uniref:CRISPR-associated helicase Cas3' n=1 Tax=Phytoactinopolyspora limicola TaxID=2715536 RepID=UPI001A9C9008|nr:CRISPR-associated helicase Cas3' [Phytoactinopolyspora limicola]
MAGQLSDAARSAWAKSPNDERAWLPLWQHMDDSADVADMLFDQWLSPNVVRLIAAEFGGDVRSAHTAVQLLAGLHDIGKATPAFAVQNTELGQRMSNLGLYTPPHKNDLPDRQKAHHTITGHHIFQRWLLSQGWDPKAVNAWAVVIGGHHGVPPDAMILREVTPDGYPDLYSSARWDDVRNELLERQAERTGARPFFGSWSSIKLSQPVQVLLTAVVIVADWIASNDWLFPFHAAELPEVADDGSRVRRAWKMLRLPSPWRARADGADVASYFSARFQFPDGAAPRPVQSVAVDVAANTSTPGLMIVEAPMGEGKTEAALAAAEILASRWGIGGLCVALPTQATSDAMFTRVVRWLDAIGDDGQQVGGSITLMHGKKQHNRLYQGMMPDGRPTGVDPEHDDGHQHAVLAHSWISGRKKASLANFMISTIDQLLFAGLKSRHLMLRHLGLASKVVVIDEVHAYDAFMNSYLTRVLTWLGAYGVPVIALSATLPADRRRELVAAYQRGWATTPTAGDGHDDGVTRADTAADLDGDIGYPVLTWTDGGRVRTRVTEPSGRATTVHLDALDVDENGDDTDALVSVLRDALSDGGTALVVRNTVRRVTETAQRLEQEFPGEVTVAHSQFITADRLRKDQELLNSFGPPERATRRPQRHVVVASQVVEQSLDVDFDVLVTDLAPVDLVLQRIGRLHRHQRGPSQAERPSNVRTARAYVGGADFTQNPPGLESGSERIYKPHVLFRAAAVLRDYFGGAVELPVDIAPLVQRAYGADAVGPTDWQEAMTAAEEAWLKKADERRAKADDFQIRDPAKPGKAIVGWVNANVGDADDEAQGQGQVRDGAPTLEAILVQAAPDGRWHTPSWLADGQRDLNIPRDEAPSDELALIMAACGIRLGLRFSTEAAEDELWAATPPAWESSSLIYRLPVLVVDEDGWGELDGRRVRYTAQRGLEVFNVDHQ